MRLIIALTVVLVTALIPAQYTYGAPPVATGTIYGKVHYNGKAVSNILVEVMIGDCFAPVFKVLSTNQAGFYRVDRVRMSKPVHIGINGFSKSGALNKLYRATCGNGVTLRAGQLNRHNIALESQQNTKQQQCIAAGGFWSNTGFIRGCNYTYSDGGKACTDSNQCQGNACLAASRDQNATVGVCPTTSFSRSSSCNGLIRNSRWFPKPCA